MDYPSGLSGNALIQYKEKNKCDFRSDPGRAHDAVRRVRILDDVPEAARLLGRRPHNDDHRRRHRVGHPRRRIHQDRLENLFLRHHL